MQMLMKINSVNEQRTMNEKRRSGKKMVFLTVKFD